METQIINGFKLKIILTAVVVMGIFGATEAFSQEANVYRIQSLFLYNFTKHVKWENTEGATFTIGVFGSPNAYEEIKANLENKVVWGNKINVIQLTSPAEMSSCHIAYMPMSNKKKIVDFMEHANTSNTLLVTEDDLMSDGAAISFVYQQSKLNFKISKEKIEQAGLKVSSSLVSIGIPV